MDADLPALALAVCDLHQRSLRSGAWPRLDRRPHPLHEWLFASRRETQPGFFRSGQRGHAAVARLALRGHLAPCPCVTTGVVSRDRIPIAGPAARPLPDVRRLDL